MYLVERLKRAWHRKKSSLKQDRSGKFKNVLHKYSNAHKGKRCFVAGNGPSLNKIDMSKLKDEITLGSNRVYLGFKEWGFYFKYWGIEDVLQIKQGYKEFSRELPDDTIKFIPKQYCYLFKCKNICPVNFLYNYENYPQFSGSPDVLYHGFSITYMLLQIAVVMECNPIYLIGCDYNYDITANEMVGKKWTDQNSKSHFVPNYCAADKGRMWNLPQFDKTDLSFKHASNWVKEKNIQILNATPGSKLKFFPMVDYESIFNGRKNRIQIF